MVVLMGALGRCWTAAQASRFWGTFLLLISLVVSRALLFPEYLFNFDSINFALALDEFNPALHQPQPPGYPGFVLYTRLIHTLVPSVELVFLVAGLLAAGAALLLLRRLGDEMFGAPVGICAAVLLLSNPVFWRAGLTNQVRIFLALSTVALGLLCWRIARAEARPRAFVWTALVAGIAAGFRPFAVALFLPVAVWAAWRSRQTLRTMAVALLIFSGSVCAWFWYTMQAAGGPAAYLDLLRAYSLDQAGTSSLLMGSSFAPAIRMAASALVWLLMVTVSWIWLVPFARWRSGSPAWRRAAPLLLLWVAPAFAFQVLVHAGDPEHALNMVPVLCLAGGWVIADIVGRWQPGRVRPAAVATVVAIVLAIRLALFFAPPTAHAYQASYRSVQDLDDLTSIAFGTIEQIRANRKVFLIHCGHPVSWRNISYYYPDVDLLVLPSTGKPIRAGDVFLMKDRHRREVWLKEGRIVLPSGSEMVWLFSPDPAARHELGSFFPYRQADMIAYHRGRPGFRFQLLGVGFVFAENRPIEGR